MSGRPDRGDSGQLALMDALVFFAISTVICSVMVFYTASWEDARADPLLSSADPDNILSVYLQASVGDAFVVEGVGLELTGRERMCEVLLLLGEVALSGGPLEPFDLLLAKCGEVLRPLCMPLRPTLSVCCEDGEGWAVLVRIGEETFTAEAVSATQNLGGFAEARLHVTLVLSPALLPHGGDV